MTITCGIQPTSMVMKVLHNSCNMYTLDLTDMYALSLGYVAIVLTHTYQSNHLCTFITCKLYGCFVKHTNLHILTLFSLTVCTVAI